MHELLLGFSAPHTLPCGVVNLELILSAYSPSGLRKRLPNDLTSPSRVANIGSASEIHRKLSVEVDAQWVNDLVLCPNSSEHPITRTVISNLNRVRQGDRHMMYPSKLLSALVVVAVLAALFCSRAGAQVDTGTILGTVKDSSGAVIPGANVTVKSTDTGQERKVITSAGGDYSIPNLRIGHYSITSTHEGFKTTTLTDVELHVAQTASLDLVLNVGQVTETVEVTTSVSPLLVTDTSSLGQVINTQVVSSMPLNGRNLDRK